MLSNEDCLLASLNPFTEKDVHGKQPKKLFFAQVQRHSALHNWPKAKGRRTFDKGNDNCQPVEALIMYLLPKRIM